MTRKYIFSQNIIYFLSNTKILSWKTLQTSENGFFNVFGVFRDFWWFSLKMPNFQKMFDFQCLLNVFVQIFVFDRKYIIFYEYIGFFIFLVLTRPCCSSFRRYFFAQVACRQWWEDEQQGRAMTRNYIYVPYMLCIIKYTV